MRKIWLSVLVLSAVAESKETDPKKVLARLEDDTTLEQHRANVFWPQLGNDEYNKIEDVVSKDVDEFVAEIEKLCRPVVARRYRP